MDLSVSISENSAKSSSEEIDQKSKREKPRFIQKPKKLSGADYRCDYCRDELTNQIRIKCADCVDFDLCVDCFAMGLSVPPHKGNHRYRVIEPIKLPIFDPDWTADEEMLLLEAIHLYGFGNWSDVSEHVGSKSKYRCESHYIKGYLSSETSPFPVSLLDSEVEIRNTKEKGENIEKMLKEIKSFKKPNFPSLKVSKPGLPHTIPRSEMHPSMLTSTIIGFSSHRGDFETEHENNAEKMLADMQFNETDTEYEKNLKLKVIKIYNKKLDERRERKDFLLRRGIHAVMPKNKRKLTSDEKEIHLNMRPFARFHSSENHEKLINGLCNELRLRKRIEELQNYRLNGLKTFMEVTAYENQKNSKTKTVKSPLKTPKKKNDFDKEEIENSDLSCLEESEKDLCKALNLSASEYGKIKEAIERETFIKGMIPSDENQSLITIKIHKTAQQMNFIISNDDLEKVKLSNDEKNIKK